jgi:type IV fimbrial biogenesis protein FimT
MLKAAHNQYGVSLLELMIAIVIGSILMMLAIPSFQSWIHNTQIRTAAESILNGLQIARSKAVHENKNVRFNLTNATGMVAWTVCMNETANPCATADVIQSRAGNEGGTNAQVGISVTTHPSPIPAGYFNVSANIPAVAAGLPAGVTFDGLGRIPARNPDGSANNDDITWINVTNARSATARRMAIVIQTGGQIRMCDPALALASNPQGCS